MSSAHQVRQSVGVMLEYFLCSCGSAECKQGIESIAAVTAKNQV